MSPPKSKFEKFLDLFKKKPPSPNTTQSPKKDYQLIAKQVYTFLLKKRRYVSKSTSVFTRIERLQDSIPNTFTDDIEESINIGISAISYSSDYTFIRTFGEKTSKEQMKYLKDFEITINNQQNLELYISMATYYLYKKILFV